MIEVIDERADSIRLEPPGKKEKVLSSGLRKETAVNITRLKGSRALLDVRRYLT